MIAEWLLVLCLGTSDVCNERGSVSATRVSEVQCKAAISLDPSITGYCISPDGEVVKREVEVAEQK